MKFVFSIIVLFYLYHTTFGFKPKLTLKQNNLDLKKNNIDRNLYAKYLKDIRKTQKALVYLQKTTKYINKTEVNNYQTIDNTDTKLKQIIIDNKIYIDVENIKTINIIAEKGELNIELDKKKPNNITDNIKEFDLILNLLNIILALQGNS